MRFQVYGWKGVRLEAKGSSWDGLQDSGHQFAVPGALMSGVKREDFKYCLVLSPISHLVTCSERRKVRVTVQETPYTLIHQTYLRDHPAIGFIQSSLNCLTATWLFP